MKRADIGIYNNLFDKILLFVIIKFVMNNLNNFYVLGQHLSTEDYSVFIMVNLGFRHIKVHA